jgi:hypothetical protein
MAVASTLLSTLIARMQRWRTILPEEEQYLIYDLDEAIRAIARKYNFPWLLKKSTIRVFKDVLEYPMASDHNVLAIIEGQQDTYEGKPHPYYTSIRQFYDDPNNYSQIAEIWDSGSKYLGIRNKKINGNNTRLDTGEVDSGYTLAGDAVSKALDTVVFKNGNGSLRVEITNALGTATISRTFTASGVSDYKRKYYFRWVYLPSVPTSITLRFGTDSGNYLYTVCATQFSGQSFKAGDWNLIGIDLDTATVSGTINSNSFAYEAIVLTGASTGSYFLDESSLKAWQLMDYWYYSDYIVIPSGGTVATKKYFMDTAMSYVTSDSLIGQEEFADVIMYDAMITSITDRENSKIFPVLDRKRQEAFNALLESYPDMVPLIMEYRYRFSSQDDLYQDELR